MGLTALGINHTTAVLDLRERVAFAPEQLVEALQGACAQASLAELVILSTCNRTELFFLGDDEEHGLAQQSALRWLARYHGIEEQEIAPSCYIYADDAALRHMIKVASGLDSMVLGEPQILGQMKSALAVAQEADTVGSSLSRVFRSVFSVAKRVRTDTAIGENPVSVAYAAVDLSSRIFTDLAQTKALLIGAGETIELVARHLADSGLQRIVVANRTLGRARELAEQFGAEAVLLAEVPDQLEHADIVITSTASQLPILGKGAVERALKLRKHRPILMVDIAVPRDIEPQVGELKDVYLYSIDDLREIVDENRLTRKEEAGKADEIVAAGVAEFGRATRALQAVDSVKALRSRAESFRAAELERALRGLAKGDAPEQVLEALSRGLTNKLIHSPSAEMKRASAEGREDLLEAARLLLGLNEGQE
jgi:glutamyl-tRNA reductase